MKHGLTFLYKDHVEKTLGGSPHSVAGAFLWHETPQGGKHWEAVASGKKKLSKRSRQYLNKLLSS